MKWRRILQPHRFWNWLIRACILFSRLMRPACALPYLFVFHFCLYSSRPLWHLRTHTIKLCSTWNPAYSAIFRVHARLQAWASLSKLKAFVQQNDMKQAIDNSNRDLEICFRQLASDRLVSLNKSQIRIQVPCSYPVS